MRSNELIKIIGQDSGKVYAEGKRADCFRSLQERYPTSEESTNHRSRRNLREVYPETLLVLKGVKK